MSQRFALYDLAARHRLGADATRRLFRLAGFDVPPPGLDLWLRRGAALLAGGLAGLGMVLWVAANWSLLGRTGHFALLQGAVLAACAGALAVPNGRAAFGLLALLAVGALLAFFGQTYQTGADPWQLFAWWALLALPLALAGRSDLLWSVWAAVAMSAVALWAQAHTSRAWGIGPGDVAVYGLSWGAAALLAAGLSPALRRLTGAGVWSLRIAATFATTMVVLPALVGLFSGAPGLYWLGLLVLGLAGLALALPRVFEVGILSAVTLGIDTLLVCGLGDLLLRGSGDVLTAELLVLGLAAAALVAGSVTVLLRLARLRAGERT